MKKISLCIMSGSGNDFVVVDNRSGVVNGDLHEELVRIVRKEGRDGLLLLEGSSKSDFKMRIINSDGSEAEMCGNGARCIAKFAQMNEIAQDKMKFETLAGEIEAEVAGNWVKIWMTDPTDIRLNQELRVNGETKIVHHLNTGVPHTVLVEEELEGVDVISLGRTIRFHQDFQPQGTNVDFMSILGDDTIKIRTYERGVESETLACGTGAVASTCVAYLLDRVSPPVGVWTKSGEILRVYFELFEGKIVHPSLEGEVKILREEENKVILGRR